MNAFFQFPIAKPLPPASTGSTRRFSSSSRLRRRLELLALCLLALGLPLIVPATAADLPATTPPINLIWNANPEPELAGYKVYYGTTSKVYTQSVDIGNQTTATLTNLSAGVTYFSVVTAYDAQRLESPPSVEISFTPAALPPPPPPTVTLETLTPPDNNPFPVSETAPLMSDHSPLPSGESRFTITAPAGQTLEIYATTDLLNWTQVATSTNPSGMLRVTDHQSANGIQRFYQVVPR